LQYKTETWLCAAQSLIHDYIPVDVSSLECSDIAVCPVLCPGIVQALKISVADCRN
jgi:hypothetical protein